MTHQNQLDKVLERLDNPRKYGNSWRSRCPAHNGKNPTSLKIDVGRNGKPLLRCHSEHCSELEILHSIGLELADLYDRPTETYKTPRQTWEQRELMKMRRWREVRPDFLIEVTVLLSAAGQVYQGHSLSEEDMVRMLRAGKIIRSALDYL